MERCPGIVEHLDLKDIASFLRSTSGRFALQRTSIPKTISKIRKEITFWITGSDHGVGSTDHFSALKIWMFENKFVSLPSHLKTIEPMEVHRGQELCVIQKLQK